MPVQKLRPKEALAKAAEKFFGGPQPAAGFVSVDGNCTMDQDEHGSFRCKFNLKLMGCYINELSWEEPLPKIQVTYFTDLTNLEDDATPKEILLQYCKRGNEIDKNEVWFEDDIRHVKFEEWIFIGLKIDKDKEPNFKFAFPNQSPDPLPESLMFCFKTFAKRSDEYPKTLKTSYP